jgi:hypothetical protein
LSSRATRSIARPTIAVACAVRQTPNAMIASGQRRGDDAGQRPAQRQSGGGGDHHHQRQGQRADDAEAGSPQVHADPQSPLPAP